MDDFYSNRIFSKDNYNQYLKKREGGFLRPLYFINKYDNSIFKNFSGNLLDIGCGHGVSILKFSEIFPRAKLYGLEINKSQIIELENIISQKNIKNIKIMSNSGQKTGFEDELFDIILCEQVLEHTEDQIGVLLEIKRILKPGGVCFVSIPNFGFPIYESHAGIPFVHLLPKMIAEKLIKIFKGTDYYKHIYPISNIKLEQKIKEIKGITINFVSKYMCDNEYIKNISYGKEFKGRKDIKLYLKFNYIVKKLINYHFIEYLYKRMIPYGAFILKKNN